MGCERGGVDPQDGPGQVTSHDRLHRGFRLTSVRTKDHPSDLCPDHEPQATVVGTIIWAVRHTLFRRSTVSRRRQIVEGIETHEGGR
ncbi:MAG: hypothetical protein HY304_04445 [candidate division Zixibacteria bacterium]|nr:hypothetical protein [candidate division Zixibacteria bacterium]